MEKRLRKPISMCCCVSPRHSYRTPQTIFIWYKEDVWTEIAKILDGKPLVMFAVTYKCLPDLQAPEPGKPAFKWIDDESHTWMFHQQEKHMDWMRIGEFLFDSLAALLNESLIASLGLLITDVKENIV